MQGGLRFLRERFEMCLRRIVETAFAQAGRRRVLDARKFEPRERLRIGWCAGLWCGR